MHLELLEWVVLVVDLTGLAVMIFGFVLAVTKFVPTLWVRSPMTAMTEIQKIRCGLGTYLVFALELMIVSDLVASMISHALEDLYSLGAIVLIRTVIGYFLNKEIQELGEAQS